jgi:hypothetical protein
MAVTVVDRSANCTIGEMVIAIVYNVSHAKEGMPGSYSILSATNPNYPLLVRD